MKSHDGPVVLGQVEHHGDGTYTITLIPQTAGPHQLLITVDGHHVQGSLYDLDVKNDYTSLLCDLQQVINVKDPLRVAIHENGDICVGRMISTYICLTKVFTCGTQLVAMGVVMVSSTPL